ncbi:sentrin-specific protease-like [Crassostrea angulata]|uniref:sentrin-specific protease-like n=1 Tax=Magallana angulata TaxID=2784310 RepID=UPI0022B0E18C|nr:sentrin-specific protease-like [Crassostrea angulata]
MALMKHKTTDLVQAIWTKWEGSTEEKMGLVHGLTMYVADIATLRPGEELNDQIINAYISIIKKKTDQVNQTMLCVSSPIISSIMLGKGHMGWSKKQDIRDYDVVIGCVNEKSCHSVTFVLDVQHRRCVVMDPPHKTKSLRLNSKHLNSFSKTMGYGEWQLSSSSDVPIQQDFTSCGIFCLKVYE